MCATKNTGFYIFIHVFGLLIAFSVMAFAMSQYKLILDTVGPAGAYVLGGILAATLVYAVVSFACLISTTLDDAEIEYKHLYYHY